VRSHPMTTFSQIDQEDLLFPDSDGKPMSDNTEQFRWIVTIKENLEILFADQPDVFIAGDLLWYPVRSTLVPGTAPDAMVIFGRPKGRRGSYKQWQEDNIAPQVVFEILSPSNTVAEMERKREFYETYGVEEYYQYDPGRLRLKGWQRQNNQLVEISQMTGWVSPRLGVRFNMAATDMEIYRPDGRKFLTSVELEQRAQAAEAQAEQQEIRAEQQRLLAEEQRLLAEAQRLLAEEQRLLAEAEKSRADQAEEQLRQVVQSLLDSGMPIAQVANVTGLSIEQINQWQRL
jgi:Uma2 family endonuclease